MRRLPVGGVASTVQRTVVADDSGCQVPVLFRPTTETAWGPSGIPVSDRGWSVDASAE
jgi:hypothetical protein